MLVDAGGDYFRSGKNFAIWFTVSHLLVSGGKVLEVVGLIVEVVFNFFCISLLYDFGYLVTGSVRQWGTPLLWGRC